MKTFYRSLTLAAALLLLLPIHSLAITDYSAVMLNAQEEQMVNFVREDRARYGLSMPIIDPELCQIARIKAQDMLSNGYFSHISPTFGNIRTMLTQFGVTYKGASENIARSRSVEHAQASFLSSSEGHRATLMGRHWTHMGIGIVTTPQGFVYAVQIFARR